MLSKLGQSRDFIEATNGTKEEIINGNWDKYHRSDNNDKGTSWLINVSIKFVEKNSVLLDFLYDCSNKDAIIKSYEINPQPYILKLANLFHYSMQFCFKKINIYGLYNIAEI